MGIRDRPSAARSPWQNGHTERLIGSIRRDALITSWCSASGTFATFWYRTNDITMTLARTYR
jgi:hypothetical protein